ncbi:MAG: hypothetical protein NXH75_15035, partial [Halobacteriovoraceae bacterium]|nr:hypothetical protein [Halobacteriovoraceae bacterium]
MNKCKLDVTDTTESDAQVTRKLANYQSCVKSMIPKMRECQQLIKPDGNGAPAATNSVQLIGQ